MYVYVTCMYEYVCISYIIYMIYIYIMSLLGVLLLRLSQNIVDLRLFLSQAFHHFVYCPCSGTPTIYSYGGAFYDSGSGYDLDRPLDSGWI